MKDRYFVDCISEKIMNHKQVIIANKINGKWIKIPSECYKVIKYSLDNSISLDNLFRVFSLDEDKKYYNQVINLLEHIGLISYDIISEFKLNRINLISFSLTNRCNLRCNYCSVDSKIENKDYLDTNQVKKSIDNIVKLNPRTLTITGGEPLMRKDFLEILSYIKDKFKGKLILATNATLIKDEEIDNIINGLHGIEISLDGYDEASCSQVRGRGTFNRVISIIEKIKSKKFNQISISMVVGKNNENNIVKFNKLNKDLGTKPVIRRFMNIGRGNENFSRYLEDELDVDYICKDDYTDKKKLSSNMCKAGVNQISIDYKGDVYPCPNLEYDDLKMFNILDFNESIIDTILDRNIDIFDEFDKLKPINMKSCKGCKVSIFCTTCPAKMYILKDSEEMFNVNCKRMKKILEPVIW